MISDWYLEAACRNSDPGSFFPDGTQWRQYLTAKKVCRSCPVRGECLTYAITHRIEHGVWGNTTPEERRRMSNCGRRAG